jgi:colanic acid biosynthesis glycosyl transferase WcaI
MRILFVCHHYRPEVGAPQRRWDAFISEWCRLGHEVTVITALPHYPAGRLLDGCTASEMLGATQGEHGETVIRVPFLPVGRRGGAAKLANQAFVALGSTVAAPMTRPDVVVSSVPGPATLAAADALATRYRVPHVLELRDAWPDLLYEGSPDGTNIPASFGRWMTRRQRRADAVVSVTRSFADELVTRGVHQSRVHHVSNGIDSREVPTLRPPDDVGGPLRLLYLGTHGVSQGLDNAVEALARVGTQVQARFIGDGTERAALQELADRTAANIEFLPSVSGAALWEAYAWAESCLVHLAPLPAFDHTVPSKLYEIMALGRHVTGVLSGEAATIVHESNAGVTVAPGNPEALAEQLRRLAEDRSTISVGDAPRVWVEANADLRPLAHKFAAIIDQVVN